MSVMRVVILVSSLLAVLLTSAAVADDLDYRYEGNVLPYEAPSTWQANDPCEFPCTEALENGHFVLRWWDYSDVANYHLWIARREDPPPPENLWVEWRFRSNNLIPLTSFICDGSFFVHYRDLSAGTYLFADAAVAASGSFFVLDLPTDQFHTFRFETLDGWHYRISVNGDVFVDYTGHGGNGAHYVQFGGRGGCTLDLMPRVNEWDFVRYGTISYGEQIVASDPPSGYLDARRHIGLDRFTITFDSPNYIYLDEITVQTTGRSVPVVTQTRRLDNGAPETVEIVLDRPIPFDETTRFTFNDGLAVNVIEYTYAPADANGNGRIDLFDVGVFQTCFSQSPPTGICRTFDLRPDNTIDLFDLADLTANLAGP